MKTRKHKALAKESLKKTQNEDRDTCVCQRYGLRPVVVHGCTAHTLGPHCLRCGKEVN